MTMPPPLLAEIDERGWFWLAVMVILFLRWLWKNAVASSQRKKAQREGRLDELEDFEEEEAYFEPDEQTLRPAQQQQAPAPPPLPPQTQPQPQPADELRKFLEQLAGVPAAATATASSGCSTTSCPRGASQAEATGTDQRGKGRPGAPQKPSIWSEAWASQNARRCLIIARHPSVIRRRSRTPSCSKRFWTNRRHCKRIELAAAAGSI